MSDDEKDETNLKLKWWTWIAASVRISINFAISVKSFLLFKDGKNFKFVCSIFPMRKNVKGFFSDSLWLISDLFKIGELKNCHRSTRIFPVEAFNWMWMSFSVSLSEDEEAYVWVWCEKSFSVIVKLFQWQSTFHELKVHTNLNRNRNEEFLKDFMRHWYWKS